MADEVKVEVTEEKETNNTVNFLDSLEKFDEEDNAVIAAEKSDTADTNTEKSGDEKKVEEKETKEEKKEGEGDDDDKKDKGKEGKDKKDGDDSDNDGEKGKEKEGEEVSIEDKLKEKDDIINELRHTTREQKKKLNELSNKYDEITKKLSDAKITDPEDESEVKQQQDLVKQRNEILESYLETMRLNPKFEDVDEVCSEMHFSDLVELMAKAIVHDDPKQKFDDVVAAVESEIWGLSNPYRFMYDNIKKYHPDYRKEESVEKKDIKIDKKENEDENKNKDKKVEKKVEPAKAATSLADIGTGGVHKSGWTAAQIDALPESELKKVPKDVYDLYMKDLLP